MLQSPGRRPMTGVRSRRKNATLDIQPEVLVVDRDAKLGARFASLFEAEPAGASESLAERVRGTLLRRLA